MSDKRKLPVIYVRFTPAGAIDDSTLYVVHKLAGERAEYHDYVPQPPTCATCKSWVEFGTPVGPDFVSVCVGHECNKGLEPCPQDGSGGCHNHAPIGLDR
jgi:hypothetical protein